MLVVDVMNLVLNPVVVVLTWSVCSTFFKTHTPDHTDNCYCCSTLRPWLLAVLADIGSQATGDTLTEADRTICTCFFVAFRFLLLR